MKRSEEMESSVCDLLERSEKIVGQGEGGGGVGSIVSPRRPLLRGGRLDLRAAAMQLAFSRHSIKY